MKYNSKLGSLQVSYYQLSRSKCFKVISQIPHSLTQYGESRENFWGQNSCLQYPASGSSMYGPNKSGYNRSQERKMSTKRVASHGVHVSMSCHELTVAIQSACRFVTTDESKAEKCSWF